jgi:magnesium-transporting ATPase (P-type)
LLHSNPLDPSTGLSNSISTTKFTVLTWLPISLGEQFRRFANIFFLIISIMLMIGTYAPEIYSSPLDPYSTVMTLLFVLMVTSIKEGLEDLERAKHDSSENNGDVVVVTFDVQTGKPIETVKQSKDVKGGDVIKLTGHSQVPVDFLIILTSNYKDGNTCYIETAQIDGETNLKVREAPQGVDATSAEPNINLFNGSIECELPNKNIHNFAGALELKCRPQAIPLNVDNIIWRGSLFSNTDWAYGIAVYCGEETKVQLNNMAAVSKMSRIEQNANVAILGIALTMVGTVTMSVIAIYACGYENYDLFPYVFPPGTGHGLSALPLWAEQWFIFFLLFNNFVPISLYVTLEMINVGQAYFIANDLEMYEPSIDSPCIVKSSNMCQELGMVSNIFSDKTGTLTRNEMIFKKCVVEGVCYDVEPNSSAAKKLRAQPNFESSTMYAFMRCLALCHTVVRESSGTFRAESPDELALVEGVVHFGFELLERGTASIEADLSGEKKIYDVLAVNAFNSDRKRSSLMLYDPTEDLYLLVCKGADSVMMDLCEMDVETRASIDKDLYDLACEGLRTLVVGQKVLTKTEGEKWLTEFKDAAASMTNRAGKMGAAADSIERGMMLLGITAIEDRLQDEVPECIASFIEAGIVVWMLTGDKEETAIQIAHSCNLVAPQTQKFFLSKKSSAEEFKTGLIETYNSMCIAPYATSSGVSAAASGGSDAGSDSGAVFEVIADADAEPVKEEAKGAKKSEEGSHDFFDFEQEGTAFTRVDGAVDMALVIDGPSFRFFDDQSYEQRQMLLAIGQASRSVVACRLTPIQKQMMVGLVKNDAVPATITLAIGDGANDVSMIKEANVGIGIIGKEGCQAANNADFAIGQFKFLKRLLLVHGRANYMRASRVFLYSIHKNFTLTMTLVWFSYFTALTGTSLYESNVYTAFNLMLGLPIVVFGVFNKDVDDEFAMSNPWIYASGRMSSVMNQAMMIMWAINASFYAIIISATGYYILEESFHEYGIYEFGTHVFCGLVFALQCKVLFIHNNINWLHVGAMGMSIAGTFGFIMGVSQFQNFYGEAEQLYDRDLFWLTAIFGVPVTCFLVDLVSQSIVEFLLPTNDHVIAEVYQKVRFVKSRRPPTCHNSPRNKRRKITMTFAVY